MRRAWLLLLAGFLSAGEPAAVGLALPARGEAISAPLAITGKGLTAAAATLAWADLVACAQPRTPASAISGGVVTREGEILRGLPLDLAAGTLRWNSDLLGARSQPIDGISAIILGPLGFAALAELLAGEPGALLANGERIAGTLTFLNNEAVGLDTGRRIAQVPRGRIAAVLLRPVQPATQQSRTWLLLVSGDRVLAGGAVEPAPQAVIAAWSEGPDRTHLTAQPPLRAVATDRLGAALPIRPGSGFPTQVGGLATATGVKVPARGEIAWACSGSTRLLAWAACAADSEAVVATVAVDGTVQWEQTLQPGAAAVPVVVALRGGSEVALRAAALADGETARRQVVWGMPILVK